eukprot:COSAG06_NODE_3292_length_5547_cov_22.916483_5_plen_34_part_00
MSLGGIYNCLPLKVIAKETQTKTHKHVSKGFVR